MKLLRLLDSHFLVFHIEFSGFTRPLCSSLHPQRASHGANDALQDVLGAEVTVSCFFFGFRIYTTSAEVS